MGMVNCHDGKHIVRYPWGLVTATGPLQLMVDVGDPDGLYPCCFVKKIMDRRIRP